MHLMYGVSSIGVVMVVACYPNSIRLTTAGGLFVCLTNYAHLLIVRLLIVCASAYSPELENDCTLPMFYLLMPDIN